MGKVKDTTLFLLIRNYLEVYLPTYRKCSGNTILSYRAGLNQYLDFVSQRNGISRYAVTASMFSYEMVTEYLQWLVEEKHASPATCNNRLAVIRAFISYASACKPEYIDLMQRLTVIKGRKNETFGRVDYMSESAVKALLEAPDCSTIRGLTDQFMMIMLYDTGARIQELLDLKICDIQLGTTPTVKLHGKGDKTRIIPLMSETVKHLKNYMRAAHPNESTASHAYLFYTTRNGRKGTVCDDTARYRIQKYVKAAQEKCREVPDNPHPHLWRHSRAMHLYQHGMDLERISQWLGHSNLETTLVYAHSDTEDKRRAIEAALGGNAIGEVKVTPYIVDDDEVLRKLYGL